MKEKNDTKIRWHRLLGKLLEELLIPVGISVFTDFPVMSEAPEADILLLRKENREWTEEQKNRLPDGVRDTDAVHILMEFKYSESVNEKAFRQIISYEYLYRQIRKLREHEVAAFLLSSKTPRKTTLSEFAYHREFLPGVYKSDNRFLRNIPLLSLNELSDEPHNTYMKCFASKKKEKENAAGIIRQENFFSVSNQVRWVLEGLWHYWFTMGGDDMTAELTPENVMKMGKMLEKAILSAMSPEELLSKYGKQKLLKALSPEDRLTGLSPEEIEAFLRKVKNG